MVKRMIEKRKSIVKRSPLQKQKQTQIVNINLAKPKRRAKGKTKGIKRLTSTIPVYIRQPEFIPPAFNAPPQQSFIPPPLVPRSTQLASSIGEALVNVPASSLLAGLTVAPRLASAATTATGSILLSAINASPNIATGIGSAIKQSFSMPERIRIQPPEEVVEAPRVERVNPFQRYTDEEIQRLLNRDLGLIPERQREGEDIPTDVEEEAVVIAPLTRRRQPLAPAPAFAPLVPEPVEEEAFFDLPEEEELLTEAPALAPASEAPLPPVPPITDPFNLETQPQTTLTKPEQKEEEVLPYTASQFEELRQQTAAGRALEKSQFPLLGAPYEEPTSIIGPPVIEINEPASAFATPTSEATAFEELKKPQKKRVVAKPVAESKSLSQYKAELKRQELSAEKKEAKARLKGKDVRGMFPVEAEQIILGEPLASEQSLTSAQSLKEEPSFALPSFGLPQRAVPIKEGLERKRPEAEAEAPALPPFSGFAN